MDLVDILYWKIKQYCNSECIEHHWSLYGHHSEIHRDQIMTGMSAVDISHLFGCTKA